MTSRPAAVVLVLLVVAGTALRVGSVARPGFSLDEELTGLAVRGIAASALPVLPSGVFYHRGLPYSYAAWASGAVLGQTMEAWRVPAVLAGICAIPLVFLAARRWGAGTEGALVAAALMAFSPTQVIFSQWARFYAPFVAVYLAAVVLLPDVVKSGSRTVAYAITLVLACLLHEFGLTLLLMPAAMAISTDSSDLRARAWRVMWISTGLAVLAELLVLAGRMAGSASATRGSADLLSVARPAVPGLVDFFRARLGGAFATPPVAVLEHAGLLVTVIVGLALGLLVWVARRRTAMPWTVAIAAWIMASFFQLGCLAVLSVLVVVLRPSRLRSTLIVSGSLGIVSLGLWTASAVATTHASLSANLVRSLLESSLAYPTDALVLFVKSRPLLSIALGCLFVMVVRRPDWDRTIGPRVMAALLVSTLVLLGLLTVPLAERYLGLLTPIALTLLACVWFAKKASDSGLVLQEYRRGRAVAIVVGCVVATAALGAEQFIVTSRSDLGDPREPCAFRRCLVPGTSYHEQWSAVARSISPGETVICNDDVACRYVIGRVDLWLTFGSRELLRFVARDRGETRSAYTGAAVISTPDAFNRTLGGRVASMTFRVVLMNTGKSDYQMYRTLAADATATYGGEVTVSDSDLTVIRFGPRQR